MIVGSYIILYNNEYAGSCNSTLYFRRTFRILRKGIISTPGASVKYHSLQSEKASVLVNTHHPNTLEVKSGTCLGSLVRACLKVRSKKGTGVEPGVRLASSAKGQCCKQTLEETEWAWPSTCNADGAGTERQNRGLLDFFSCFYVFRHLCPCHLPAMKELSKEGEVLLAGIKPTKP